MRGGVHLNGGGSEGRGTSQEYIFKEIVYCIETQVCCKLS